MNIRSGHDKQKIPVMCELVLLPEHPYGIQGTEQKQKNDLEQKNMKPYIIV